MIRSLSARLEPTPLAVRETRRFVRDILRVWDAEILAEVAELLAGELVTNAVLYARTPIDVYLAWSDGDTPRLRVKVCDEADTMPQLVEPPRPAGHGGYGLRLLERFSTDWGVERHDDAGGKCVWFEVGLSSDWQPYGSRDEGLRRLRPPEESLG
jgi:anti-sigma regulatory factor (Ser/Thr protein kinase)